MRSTGATIKEYRSDNRTSLTDDELGELVSEYRQMSDREYQSRTERLRREAKEQEPDSMNGDEMQDSMKQLDELRFLEWLSEPPEGQAIKPDPNGGPGHTSQAPASENRNRFERGETCTLTPGMSARSWVENKAADSDPVFEEVSLGGYLRSLATGPETAAEERALEVGTDTAGGHLVDEQLVAQVIDALVTESVIFGDNGAGVRRIMMQEQDGDVFNFPRTDSIPSAIWHDEGVSESSQDPTFSRASANIGTLLIPIFVSRELIQDSPTIEDAIETAAIQSANAEIQGTFLGTTTTSNAPSGLQDDGSRQTVSASSGFDYDELLDLIGDVMGADGAQPTAAIEAPANAVARAKLKTGDGRPLPQPPLVEDMQFFQTTSIPTDQGGGSDETSVFVGDFGRYSGVVFRTDGVVIETSREHRMDSFEFTFLLHARLAPVILRPAALGEYDSIVN